MTIAVAEGKVRAARMFAASGGASLSAEFFPEPVSKMAVAPELISRRG